MKRTIKFNLFPKKIGGELVECLPIRMRVSYAGHRVDFRVGYSIEPEKWNEEDGRVISNTKNKFRQPAGEINKAITTCEEQIEAIFTRFELIEKRVPSPTELKAAFDEITGRAEPIPEEEVTSQPFYKAYAEFMDTMGRLNDWTKATYTKFNSLRRHLEAFSELPLN